MNLELYHVNRILDGGPDNPQYVAAICSNCHKRFHYGNDGAEYNHKIVNAIQEKEENL